MFTVSLFTYYTSFAIIMDFTDQTAYPERHHSPGLGMDAMADLEDGEDFVALDSGVSVVSSEWRNVSSSGSSSHVEDELTAKECVLFNNFVSPVVQNESLQHRELARILGHLDKPSPCCYDEYQRHYSRLSLLSRSLQRCPIYLQYPPLSVSCGELPIMIDHYIFL